MCCTTSLLTSAGATGSFCNNTLMKLVNFVGEAAFIVAAPSNSTKNRTKTKPNLKTVPQTLGIKFHTAP